MSIGPLGTTASAAGSPLAQTKGAGVERATRRSAPRRRQVYHEQKAEAAAGVGSPTARTTRRPSATPTAAAPGKSRRRPNATPLPPDVRQSKDPSRQSGNLLDLTG